MSPHENGQQNSIINRDKVWIDSALSLCSVAELNRLYLYALTLTGVYVCLTRCLGTWPSGNTVSHKQELLGG